MQMWVKDAAANTFLKLLERWGGGACPSSRFLPFLTSKQTASFPRHIFRSAGPREGVMELGCARAQNQPLGCTSPREEGKQLEELGPGNYGIHSLPGKQQRREDSATYVSFSNTRWRI